MECHVIIQSIAVTQKVFIFIKKKFQCIAILVKNITGLLIQK